MKNKKITYALIALFALNPLFAYATDEAYIVINEVQIAGESATDEFVELYNPTDVPIDLTSYSLKKFTASGNASNLVGAFPEVMIEAHGYLLVAHPNGYTNEVLPDLTYSTSGSIAGNNSVALLNANGETVDLLGFGEATMQEDINAPNPDAHQSVARTNGNDTNNNADDFALQETSAPQSSVSAVVAELNLTPVMLQNICSAWLQRQAESTATEPPAEAESTETVAVQNETSSETNATSDQNTTQDTSSLTITQAPSAETQETDETEDAQETQTETTQEEIVETEAEPLSYPAGALVITELYPAPLSGEAEWIELWNATAVAIGLEGWNITDASGAITELAGTIESSAYFQVENPKGKLNNGGDTVTLLDPAGGTIDTVTYGDDIDYGEAYARDGSTWLRTTTPTPLAANVISGEVVAQETEDEETATSNAVEQDDDTETSVTEQTDLTTTDAPQAEYVADDSPQETQTNTQTSSTAGALTVSVSEARALATGTLIKTQGVVSVPPGVFGTNTFYVAGSGMRVYLHGIAIPQLAVGDVVSLMGKMGSSGGETRIVVSLADGLKIVDHAEAPTPNTIELGEVGEESEGWLITTEGTIVQKLSDRFILEDDSGTVPVIIKSEADINKDDIQIGSQVRVTGIVSETTSGFRLVPRSSNDLMLLELSETGEVTPTGVAGQASVLTILAGFFVSILMVMVVRKQVVTRKKGVPTEPLVL